MVANGPVERLLEDLRKVRQVCNENNVELVPEVAVDYLFTNREVIRGIVNGLYDSTDQDQRASLLREHRELDSSVLSNDDETRKLVLLAVWKAEHERESGFGLLQISDDNVHMLMRSLEYAKYVTATDRELGLRMSPIEKYGLRRKIGNFESITPEEYAMISWHLADIAYDAEKRGVLEKLRSRGGDLGKMQLMLPDLKYPESLAEWTERIIGMLRYKAECDLAVVLLATPSGRDKYLNTIISRMLNEFLDFLDSLRQGINHLHEVFAEGGKLTHLQAMSLEHHLDPVRSRYEELAGQVSAMQPRPAIYLIVQSLRGGKMGNTYNVYGPAGAVGDGATASHFQQVWGESKDKFDLAQLAAQLDRLRQVMASEAKSPERETAMANVQSAASKATENDGPGVLHALSKAGSWAFDIASKIGADLVVAAFKTSLGIP